MRKEEIIAEIIESSTMEVVAQCWEERIPPPFGSFVCITSRPEIYGLVWNISTHSVDPNRRPTAYQMTEEELRDNQPQIFELLKTDFNALIIGYKEGNEIVQILPPKPPGIHCSVRACFDEEIREFSKALDYLRLVVKQPRIPADDLIIAACRNSLSVHELELDYLVKVGKELSRLFKGDYDRLSSILRRIAHWHLQVET